MTTEVIVISDASDSEIVNDCNYASDNSDILVLSVSSPVPEPPSSSQPRASSWENLSEVCELDNGKDDCDSEGELLDARALVSASQSQMPGSQRSGIASRPKSEIRRSVCTALGSRERKSSLDSSHSGDSLVVDPLPQKLTQRRQKKSEEEKAREKAEKEARKLARQEEARCKKEAAAAERAAEKLAKKAHRDANKLVSKKTSTMQDMTVELSTSLVSSPLHATLAEKMKEFECLVTPIADEHAIVRSALTGAATNLNALGVKVVRWKRHVRAMYDEHSRQWFPLQEGMQYARTEGTYLIFMAEHDVRREPSVTEQVHRVRTALGPKHHLHLMLCGWKPRKEEREPVEQELVRLQVREGVFVEQVPNVEEAVNWIHNMTADLGIKPHKLIERSHLPFCAIASSAMKVGNSDEDAMVHMLTQLPRLTDPVAKAIVREYGTINRVMEAYQKQEVTNPTAGPMVLAHMPVSGTQTGKETSRVVNKALSERLYSLLWGNDPKALVN